MPTQTGVLLPYPGSDLGHHQRRDGAHRHRANLHRLEAAPAQEGRGEGGEELLNHQTIGPRRVSQNEL